MGGWPRDLPRRDAAATHHRVSAAAALMLLLQTLDVLGQLCRMNQFPWVVRWAPCDDCDAARHGLALRLRVHYTVPRVPPRRTVAPAGPRTVPNRPAAQRLDGKTSVNKRQTYVRPPLWRSHHRARMTPLPLAASHRNPSVWRVIRSDQVGGPLQQPVRILRRY